MARVNHKRVKQLLNEKRSRITDRQFFTSRILAGHFEDMAMAQTRRYKYNRRIHVAISWSPKSGEVACTNNLSVLINAGHRLVTQNRGRDQPEFRAGTHHRAYHAGYAGRREDLPAALGR